ncbi:MAG: OmpA family protein [Oculatellaceae cyanobacterium bins.114]|nr:OmpA family protein [Oculatellaceae cyanobacterium bins.114]
MTKTSPTSIHDPSMTPKPHPVRSFLVLVFRLLLLGIGGGFAALLGVAIAHFRPALNPSEPLVSRLFHQSAQIIHRANRSAPTPASAPPVATAPSGAGTATPATSATPAVVTTNLDTLTFTLPSDALFEADQTVLRPDTQSILDAVKQDIQRYPGAVIYIASHTDSDIASASESPSQSRTRSLAQAQAIEQDLAETLGDRYHWVTIGYGSTRPLVPNDSPINQQRNRRIEIIIEP